MQMGMRRFTRLANAFSKKVENYNTRPSPSLHVLQLLPCPQTLKMTPAMAAGVADHPWSVGEIVGLLGARVAFDRL